MSSRSPVALILIAFAFLSASTVKGQQTPAELGVGAVGLVVSDMAASKHFYVDVLGFSRTGGFSLDKEWSSEAGFTDGKPFSVEVLKLVDNPSATVLKLADFASVPSAELRDNISGISGANYLTFNYPHLGDVLSRIENEGIQIWGHVERPSYQVVIVRDPDGVFIELVAPKDSDR